MNVSMPSAALVVLTLLPRDAWSCAGGNGNLRSCRRRTLPLTARSESFEAFLQHALEFFGRVESFAVEQGLDTNLVLQTPTIVGLLREKLLDFKKVTHNGG